MNFILFQMMTPGEMADAQTQLAAAADSVNASVGACGSLDAATSSGWQTFYTSLKAFTAEKPVLIFAGSGEALTTGDRMTELQGLQKELLAWQQKLSGPCKNLNPGLAAPSTTASLSTILTLAVIGAGFISTAVIVSKIAREIEIFKPERAS